MNTLPTLGALVLLAPLLAACAEPYEDDVAPRTAASMRDVRFEPRTVPFASREMLRENAADQPSMIVVEERPLAALEEAMNREPIYPMEGYSEAPPRRVVSLGYIGDERLGRYDEGAQHHHPQWWRPFPASWSSDYANMMRGRRGGRR